MASEVPPITRIRHNHISANEQLTDNNLIDKDAHFNMTATTNASEVLSGDDAYLVCSVVNLGEKVVSWFRHKDMNLLSVGKFVYTPDSRYQVYHKEDSDLWTLKVSEPIDFQLKVKGSYVTS